MTNKMLFKRIVNIILIYLAVSSLFVTISRHLIIRVLLEGLEQLQGEYSPSLHTKVWSNILSTNKTLQ